jgi:hypothetical protein
VGKIFGSSERVGAAWMWSRLIIVVAAVVYDAGFGDVLGKFFGIKANGELRNRFKTGHRL